jgi:hypothetical protein
MPGKRPIKRGSFGGHFDELVKQFPHEQPGTRDDQARKPRDSVDGNIHDKLFESAWRKARDPGRTHR